MYQITVQVLVKGPKDQQHMRAADKFVHDLAQTFLVGHSTSVDCGYLEVVGASAEWAKEVPDKEESEGES